jgi:hypothetical protein
MENLSPGGRPAERTRPKQILFLLVVLFIRDIDSKSRWCCQAWPKRRAYRNVIFLFGSLPALVSSTATALPPRWGPSRPLFQKCAGRRRLDANEKEYFFDEALSFGDRRRGRIIQAVFPTLSRGPSDRISLNLVSLGRSAWIQIR